MLSFKAVNKSFVLRCLIKTYVNNRAVVFHNLCDVVLKSCILKRFSEFLKFVKIKVSATSTMRKKMEFCFDNAHSIFSL